MEKQEIKLRCLEAAVQLAAYTNKEQKVKYVLDTAKDLLKWVEED